MTDLSLLPEQAALSFSGVAKLYRMYASPLQVAVDQLGLRRLSFRKRPEIPVFSALRGLNLSIRRGERVGIVGRNGSGKTTMLKLATGAVAPSEGVIERNGTVQALMSVAGGFHPDLTGFQNIEAALSQSGLTRQRLKAAIDDVVAFTELGLHINQPFGVYSLGMQARTQFAVATAIQPDILVIDEVLGAGDGYFAVKSAHRMRALVDSGCTILLVSHDATQILQYCERVIWLREGRVHRDGPAEAVLAAYQAEMEDIAAAHGGATARIEEATDPFELPASLDTEFVAEAIRAAERVDGPAVPVRRATGRTVMSYPGKPGLRIAEIEMRASPARRTGLVVGDELELTVRLSSATGGSFAITPQLRIYSLSGERFASAAGELIKLDDLPAGSEFTFRMVLDRLLLGAQHYLLSLSIDDATAPTSTAHYDLWSRFGCLNYAPSNDSDPPLVHMNGMWHYPDRPPEDARLAARQ
ncbi:ABC transporter ATP-binding protein [Bosea sp. UC22_33]|uniref:ABC transporter ATP-binding protein n=1 Tax=Bosea sp. UC22_33 TaxID=3350165 RepID=UPI00366EB5A4